MATKEAKARIKINKLLEESGWRFFDDDNGKANVVLEPNVKLKKQQIDDLGENFEQSKNGFIDFLLLDEKGFPLVVLEAKAEDKNPLIGKEQARTYLERRQDQAALRQGGRFEGLPEFDRDPGKVVVQFWLRPGDRAVELSFYGGGKASTPSVLEGMF